MDVKTAKNGDDTEDAFFQFLLELLQNTEYKHIIRWTKSKEEFELLNADELAELWALKKAQNRKLNHYKLYNNLWHMCYNGIVSVAERRVVYKFDTLPDQGEANKLCCKDKSLKKACVESDCEETYSRTDEVLTLNELSMTTKEDATYCVKNSDAIESKEHCKTVSPTKSHESSPEGIVTSCSAVPPRYESSICQTNPSCASIQEYNCAKTSKSGSLIEGFHSPDRDIPSINDITTPQAEQASQVQPVIESTISFPKLDLCDTPLENDSPSPIMQLSSLPRCFRPSKLALPRVLKSPVAKSSSSPYLPLLSPEDRYDLLSDGYQLIVDHNEILLDRYKLLIERYDLLVERYNHVLRFGNSSPLNLVPEKAFHAKQKEIMDDLHAIRIPSKYIYGNPDNSYFKKHLSPQNVFASRCKTSSELFQVDTKDSMKPQLNDTAPMFSNLSCKEPPIERATLSNQSPLRSLPPEESPSKSAASKESAWKSSASNESPSNISVFKESPPKPSVFKESPSILSASKESPPKSSASNESPPKSSASNESPPKLSASKESLSNLSASKEFPSNLSASKESLSNVSASKESPLKTLVSMKHLPHE